MMHGVTTVTPSPRARKPAIREANRTCMPETWEKGEGSVRRGGEGVRKKKWKLNE